MVSTVAFCSSSHRSPGRGTSRRGSNSARGSSARRSSRAALTLSALALTGTLTLPPAVLSPAVAADTRSCAEAARSAEAVTDGHFDVGPRLSGTTLEAAVKDDRVPAGQWKRPESLIFALGKRARQKLPAGMESIAPAGSEVFLIGATQAPGVPWLGWNTQDPELVRGASGPVTMKLDSFSGPGKLSVFLSGSFGAAGTPVFSSHGQKSYQVPLNTHQHGNWVFTAPGDYVVRVSYTVPLKAGGTATAHAVLRFAVGEATAAKAASSPGSAAAPGDLCSAAGQQGAGKDHGAGRKDGPAGSEARDGGGAPAAAGIAAGADNSAGGSAGGSAEGAAGGEQASSSAGASQEELAQTGPAEDWMIATALYGATLLTCGVLIARAVRTSRTQR